LASWYESDEKDISKTMKIFLDRGRNETVPDQWQTQVFIRVLRKASVIDVSEMPDETIEQMHMIPAHSLEEALDKAKKMIGKENPTITAIPDGISVMVKEK
jgi:nickel-dependent lactate racemase